MASLRALARYAWRKYVSDGVAASGFNKPDQNEIFAYTDSLDAALATAINGLAIGSAVFYTTRAAMYAGAARPAGSLVIVYNDGTPAYNGVYVSNGGTGSGAYTLTNLSLPSTFATDLAMALGLSLTAMQPGDSVSDLAETTTAKIMTGVERTKLAGIASGATVNDSDANLKNRENHTGTQAINTVSGLQSALDAMTAATGNVASEVTGARGGEANLDARLDTMTADTGQRVLKSEAANGSRVSSLIRLEGVSGTGQAATATVPAGAMTIGYQIGIYSTFIIRWPGTNTGAAPTLVVSAGSDAYTITLTGPGGRALQVGELLSAGVYIVSIYLVDGFALQGRILGSSAIGDVAGLPAELALKATVAALADEITARGRADDRLTRSNDLRQLQTWPEWDPPAFNYLANYATGLSAKPYIGLGYMTALGGFVASSFDIDVSFGAAWDERAPKLLPAVTAGGKSFVDFNVQSGRLSSSGYEVRLEGWDAPSGFISLYEVVGGRAHLWLNTRNGSIGAAGLEIGSPNDWDPPARYFPLAVVDGKSYLDLNLDTGTLEGFSTLPPGGIGAWLDEGKVRLSRDGFADITVGQEEAITGQVTIANTLSIMEQTATVITTLCEMSDGGRKRVTIPLTGKIRTGSFAGITRLRGVLLVGQSNNSGWNNDPAITPTALNPGRAFMFNGGVRPLGGAPNYPDDADKLLESEAAFDLIDLREADGGNASQTIAATMAQRWLQDLPSNEAVVFINVALGSSAYIHRKKGTAPHRNAMFAAERFALLARLHGLECSIDYVVEIDGESDRANIYPPADVGTVPFAVPATVKQSWMNILHQVWTDHNLGIKAITAQPNDIVVITDQMGYSVSEVALAQLQMAIDYPDKYVCVGPKYHLPPDDEVHLEGLSQARRGPEVGRALVEFEAGIDPLPPYVASAVRAGAVITCAFAGHFVGPMVEDTTLVTDPGNKGVTFSQTGGNSVTILSVAMSGGNLIVTLSAVPTGTNQQIGIARTPNVLQIGPTAGVRACFRDQETEMTPLLAGNTYPTHRWVAHCLVNVTT